MMLRRWLGAWNIALAEKRAVVRSLPFVRPLTKQQRMAVAAVLGVVAQRPLGHTALRRKTVESPPKRAGEPPGRSWRALHSNKKLETDQKRPKKSTRNCRTKCVTPKKCSTRIADDWPNSCVGCRKILTHDCVAKIDGTRGTELTGTTMHPEHTSLWPKGRPICMRHG
jgi:hypothetical protein